MARNRGTYGLFAAIAIAGGLAVVSSIPATSFDVAQAQTSGNVTVSIVPGATGKGPQAFGQNPLVISARTTVTWVNNDTIAHTVTSDTPGQFDSGSLSPGQTFQHTFNGTGNYPYHCAIHGQQSMSGVVQVNAAGGNAPAIAPGASPVSGPVSGPSAGPTSLARFTCDMQGVCCDKNNSCVPSNHFTCDISGWCCQDDGSNCSSNYECAGGYCCNTGGHCGMSTYGSGKAHCNGDGVCCDEHGTCASGYTHCNGVTCCNNAGECKPVSGSTYMDPRPTPSASPSPSPSPSPHVSSSATPSGTSIGAPMGASSGTPSGTATGGAGA